SLEMVDHKMIHPAFWISIGIFICSILSIPVSLYHGFYFKINSDNNVNYYLSALIPLAFIFQYLGILKATIISYKNN
ncbi:MAG: hypothetical protein RIR96_832, partial [Bacteroidota bacterium]